MSIPTEMKQKGDLEQTQSLVDKHMPGMKPETLWESLAELRFGFSTTRDGFGS